MYLVKVVLRLLRLRHGDRITAQKSDRQLRVSFDGV